MDLIPRGFGFNDFFDTFLPSSQTEKPHLVCDIYEKDGEYNLVMDVPGFKKEDVKIEVEDGYLTISATKEEETEDSDKNYIRRERRCGKFQRSFYVGDVNHDKIEAKFDEGTLKVTFPKEVEKPNKKEIKIKG